MKKLEKMSLANLQGKLTRKEMKNISGGSGDPYGYYGWFSVPYNFNGGNGGGGSAGVNAGNNGAYGAAQFIVTVGANVGVALVNTAAWIGNVISNAPAPTPSPKK